MTKILLVEDDKSLREIYSVRLLAEGYTLISSGDGEEALAVAIGEKPDLIVSDVMMPKISGFEVCKRLRAKPQTRHIPVLMITALDQPSDVDRAVEVGTNDFLTKPINKTELLLRIRSALDSSQKHKEPLEQTLDYYEGVQRAHP